MLNQVLPPFLLALLKRTTNIKTKTYPTFPDALKDCQNLGYSDSEIAKQVKERTTKLFSTSFKDHQLSESDLRILLMALRASQNGTLRVLDFGGGAGYHYFLYKSWCLPKTKVDWLVVETTPMIEACTDMQNDELQFTGDIPNGAKNDFDLIILASSLQYTADPVAILTQLTQLNSKFFCLTKTPMLLKKNHIISMQVSNLLDHGPGNNFTASFDKTVLTPINFLFKGEILSLLEAKFESIHVTQDARSSFQLNGKELPAFSIFCSSI